jgi:hypothetical protein
MKARQIIKRLVLNGMLIPEYNYPEYLDSNIKIPDNIENKINIINKEILYVVENQLSSYKTIIHDTANLIINNNSITGDDIYEIFKKNGIEYKIQSYNIQELYDNIIIKIY